MPPTCSICKHAKRKAIDRAITAGNALRRIASQYGTTETSLRRHKPHVLKSVTKAHAVREVADADSVLAQLRAMGARIGLYWDACDRYLRDPEDATRYDLGPRGHDIQVVYEVPATNGDKMEQRKALLSDLLEQIAKGDPTFSVVSTSYRIADPRKLILDAAEVLGRWLDRIATLTGELLAAKTIVAVQNNTQVNVAVEIPPAILEDIERVSKLAGG